LLEYDKKILIRTIRKIDEHLEEHKVGYGIQASNKLYLRMENELKTRPLAVVIDVWINHI
jgi:hypothetical protein